MMISGLFVAMALAAPLPATVNDWWRVSNNDNAAAYVDQDSVKRDGPWLRANHMMVYTRPSAETRVKRVSTTAEYDCQRRVSRYRKFIAYDDGGAVLHNLTDPDGLVEHPAGPGTLGGGVLDFICNNDRAGAVRVANPF